MSELFRYTNFPDEPAEFESRDDELAQLRARIDALENDIICAFCGSHYKADDVPPQHYQTCGQSPLVQRIAEARDIISSCRDRLAFEDSMKDNDNFINAWWIEECDAWLSANPAPQTDDERIDQQLNNSGWESDELSEV